MTADELRAAIRASLHAARRELGEYHLWAAVLLPAASAERRALGRAARALYLAEAALCGAPAVAAADQRDATADTPEKRAAADALLARMAEATS